MRPWLLAAAVAALSLFGLYFRPDWPGVITVRNESGEAVSSVQVNVVHSDTLGELQSRPIAAHDQIYFLGALGPGAERVQTYRDTSSYNLDILVQWSDGRSARFYRTYVVDDWYGVIPPHHLITITPKDLLLDGRPPAPVESNPERDYGQFNG